MEPIKKALLATHVDDPSFIPAMRRQLRGYELTPVGTVEGALSICERSRFDVYVIEANLGLPRLDDITGFQRIYDAVHAQGVQGLEQKMVAFSSTPGALEAVARLGIPTVYKPDLGTYLSTHFAARPSP